MNVGVHDSVPLVFVPFAANVAPAAITVPEAVKEVIESPSGSTAETTIVKSEFSCTAADAGAVTTGARSCAMTGEEMLRRQANVVRASRRLMGSPILSGVAARLVASDGAPRAERTRGMPGGREIAGNLHGSPPFGDALGNAFNLRPAESERQGG